MCIKGEKCRGAMLHKQVREDGTFYDGMLQQCVMTSTGTSHDDEGVPGIIIARHRIRHEGNYRITERSLSGHGDELLDVVMGSMARREDAAKVHLTRRWLLRWLSSH